MKTLKELLKTPIAKLSNDEREQAINLIGNNQVCFDKTLIEDIINAKGHTLECEISIDDKERKIIQKVLGVTENTGNAGKPEVEVVNMSKPVDDKTTCVLTSYAKDIFVAIREADKDNTLDSSEIMTAAINLVKQARDAFK